MLSQPRMISVAAGAPLLFGLEIAGPYMFLLTGIASIGIAYGLVRRINLVRHAAILLAIAGVVLLIWDVAAAARTVQLRALTLGGLGVIVPSLSQQFRSA